MAAAGWLPLDGCRWMAAGGSHSPVGQPGTGRPGASEPGAQSPSPVRQFARSPVRPFARRHTTAHRSLLRALVSGGECCGECRLACTGRSAHPGYDSDLLRSLPRQSASDPVGARPQVPCAVHPCPPLDAVVWQDLCDVLLHPDSLAQALERASGGQWAPQELQARREQLRAVGEQLRAVAAGKRERDRPNRTVDAGVPHSGQAAHRLSPTITDYHRRRLTLEHQVPAVERQGDQLEPTRTNSNQLAADARRRLDLAGPGWTWLDLAGPGWARAVRHSPSQSVAALCQRLQSGLDYATFAQKRQLIELLIDRVVVTNGAVEIRSVIPTTPASEHVRFCHLRTDYFHDVATRVDRLVEGQGTSRSCRSTGALIAAFRNGVRDLPLSEQLTTTQVAVAFVSDEPIGARARPVGLGCPPTPASIAYCHGDVLA